MLTFLPPRPTLYQLPCLSERSARLPDIQDDGNDVPFDMRSPPDLPMSTGAGSHSYILGCCYRLPLNSLSDVGTSATLLHKQRGRLPYARVKNFPLRY